MLDWFSAFAHPLLFRNSLVISIPLCFLVAKVFFDNWDGFWDSLRLVIQPDLISLFRGEWNEDLWESFKFWMFLLVCAGVIFGTYEAALAWFGPRDV